MFLTNGQLKACATGWVDAEEQAEGLVFHRFFKEHRELFWPFGAHLVARIFTSASVTLDFCTDADAITVIFDGWLTDSLDKHITLDLYENGEMRGSASVATPGELHWPELTQVGAYTAHTALSSGEKRVTVYLPWSLLARIRSVELENGTTFRPYKSRRQWLALGDSITQGIVAEHTSMTYVNRLARMLDAHVLNLGIGGDLMRETGVLPGEYGEFDLITTAYGTNDYTKQTEEEFRRHMPAYFRNLAERYPTTPIFVLLPLSRGMELDPPEKPLGTLQAVRERIAAEAAKYPNMTVIDCKDFLPLEQKYFGDATLLHPNDIGFGRYAEKLYEVIRPCLEEK